MDNLGATKIHYKWICFTGDAEGFKHWIPVQAVCSALGAAAFIEPLGRPGHVYPGLFFVGSAFCTAFVADKISTHEMGTGNFTGGPRLAAGALAAPPRRRLGIGCGRRAAMAPAGDFRSGARRRRRLRGRSIAHAVTRRPPALCRGGNNQRPGGAHNGLP